jgi:hypothetical protein
MNYILIKLLILCAITLNGCEMHVIDPFTEEFDQKRYSHVENMCGTTAALYPAHSHPPNWCQITNQDMCCNWTTHLLTQNPKISYCKQTACIVRDSCIWEDIQTTCFLD